MTTLPFISACHSMMASEVGEPRRVGDPTRHSMAPIRHGALFLASFLGVRTLWARATSCWRPNTTWRSPNTTWRARFTLFLGDLDPWNSSHVVLEAQRDMAHSQCDVARSFCSLFGCFGAFGVEPRPVGDPTRHGALPMRRDALFYPLFGAVRPLWGGATSCWRPNATWRAPYATWRARFALFRGDSDPWISSHVVLEAQRVMTGSQRVMAHSQCDVEGRNTM